RVPAALCGVVGFKPAFGVLPVSGVHPLAPTLDHVGLFTATGYDALLASRALTGATPGHTPSPDFPDREEPVAWIPPEDIAPTDPRSARVAHDSLGHSYTLSGALGITEDLFRTFSTLQGHEAFMVHADHLSGEE